MTSENPTLPGFWKKCSSCKKEIPFRGTYYSCSVSTCNSKRLGLVFCSVPCWDAHLGFANHRAAEADEKRAPSAEEAALEADSGPSPAPAGQRRIVPAARETAAASDEAETLVVVSKVKKLIRDRSGFNTSQCCIDALTEKVAAECLKAVDNARNAGRKTVMGRDVS